MYKTLDIIIPVYNEEKTLEKVLSAIEETDFCGLEKRIILVDDASSDSSRNILLSDRCKSHLVLLHDKNRGKGAAIATALKNSTADIVVIQDADLEYNPADYNKLLPHIINSNALVVYGSRLKEKPSRKSFLLLSYLANTFLTAFTNILYGIKITDMETCYKAFSKEALDGIEIKSSRFEFEPEITAKISKKGIKIKEVPISYRGRAYHEGKKVTAYDAAHAVFTLFYYRFFD